MNILVFVQYQKFFFSLNNKYSDQPLYGSLDKYLFFSFSGNHIPIMCLLEVFYRLHSDYENAKIFDRYRDLIHLLYISQDLFLLMNSYCGNAMLNYTSHLSFLIYGRTTTLLQNMIFTAIWFAPWKKNFNVQLVLGKEKCNPDQQFVLLIVFFRFICG